MLPHLSWFGLHILTVQVVSDTTVEGHPDQVIMNMEVVTYYPNIALLGPTDFSVTYVLILK